MRRDGIFDAETLPSADATAPARPGAIGTSGPVPGQTWARYVVIEALGAGGMGAVWAAYDTELDRKVALKVLHDEWLGRASQERLRREARAMARLSHPNVVPVFDVGEHAGRSYYTMELVRGQSVKDWAKSPREPREVARVYVEAARGLAAIHDAGLVHRDVKPGNLLYGDDGRARIANLGIAMSAPEAAPVGAPLVATTTLRHAGTPAYMAPEQLRGAAGDAASDQFSFGVALWESLHGRPPFGGDSVDARLAAFEAGPTGARDVPGWLDAAARRALSPDPAARFADVASLARALEGPRARRWPIAAAAIAAATAAAAIVVVATRPGATPPTADACATASAELDDAWPAGRAAALATSLAPSRTALAADPSVVVGDLDRAVGSWRTTAAAACTRDARGAWSPQTGARATRCLARRRADLRRAIASDGLDTLAARVRDLAPAARCLDPAYLALEIEPPADPVRAALVDGTDALLDAVREVVQQGQPDLAQRTLDAMGTLAAQLAYPPLSARNDEAWAAIASARDDHRRAADVLERSYYASRAVGDDSDALLAVAALIGKAAGPLHDHALADRWIGIARADATRRPDTDGAAEVYGAIANAELAWGDAAAAVDDARHAAELARTGTGTDSGAYEHAIAMLAIALDSSGRHREALPYYDQQIASIQRRYGNDSPALLAVVQNEALALSDLGEPARAFKLAAWAQQIVDGWREASPATVGEVYLNLGVVLENAHEPAKAIPPLERALASLRAAYGDDHRDVVLALTNLALAREGVAELDRSALPAAIDTMRDAAAAARRVAGADDPDAISADLHYAGALQFAGRCRLAEPIVRRELATLDRAGALKANGSKLVGEALHILGACQLDAGATRQAIATLTRTLAVEADDTSHVSRAMVQRLLAKAYLALGDRAAASKAELARRGELELADSSAADLAKLDGWIASPSGDPP